MIYTGVDIERTTRIDHLWKTKPIVLQKMFFPSEWNYFISRGYSIASLTGIWCAKEAVVKAVYPTRQLQIKDVEIISQRGAAPRVVLHAGALGEAPIVLNVQVSIAHTSEYATATAIHWINDSAAQQ